MQYDMVAPHSCFTLLPSVPVQPDCRAPVQGCAKPLFVSTSFTDAVTALASVPSCSALSWAFAAVLCCAVLFCAKHQQLLASLSICPLPQDMLATLAQKGAPGNSG